LELGGIHAAMLGRIVPEPRRPDGHPHKTNRAEADENLTPSKKPEQPDHERRRQTAGEVSAGKEDTLYFSAIAHGNPAGECARDARPRSRFTYAEQKAHDEEDRISERRACRGCQAGPPDHNPRQYGSGPFAIRPPGRGNLE